MAWKSLRERINNLPLVLAGPIVRRTEPHSVTVWIALKASRTVTLVILDTKKKVVLTGRQKTVQLGTNLHVVAVTARSPHPTLLYGENYLYNLAFGPGETLATPGVLNEQGIITDIAYPPYDLPSFALVPNDIYKLRIIHGSCRKPHGESVDALPALDKMIGEAIARDPSKRPHQLFLTGDQIYADDVADALLWMLIDAGETLLGWQEMLPDVDNFDNLKAGKRNQVATETAGLTASINKLNAISNIAKSHLFTLGEFYAMYLFSWSDVLWTQPENFPTFADIYQQPGLFDRRVAFFSQEVAAIEEFRSTLPQVRRALANVSTYMIFDDHEITDDLFLNFAWCDRVLSKPLGRRVLQNGFLAYAVFQGWGNTPEQFESNQPGSALLNAAVGWSAFLGNNVKYEQEIALRLGIPKLEEIKNIHPKQLIRTNAAIAWHYNLNFPNYEVIVLDTRTMREFPGKYNDFPALLSKQGCQTQISGIPHQQDAKVTIVISPAPVIGVPFLEQLQKQAKNLSDMLGTVAWGFDPEAWGLETTAYERLLAALSVRALPQKRSRVIMLSGDVHYSFNSRLQYSAIRPFEYPQNTYNQLLLVQFTSSAFKNEARGIGGSYALHTRGFVPIELANNLPTSEILGWENPDNREFEIGTLYNVVGERLENVPWFIKGNPARVDLVQERGFSRVMDVTKKPQWWYRVDFLLAKREDADEPVGWSPQKLKTVVAPLPGEDRMAPLEEYLAIAKNHRDYRGKWGHGKAVVGVNNIGEITFESVEGKDTAIQTLWWRLESYTNGQLLEPFPLTRCEVSLIFDDKEHPMNDVIKEVKT